MTNFNLLCTLMALYISSLNSGSNGNCYYIGNDTEAVLVDAGISCREVETRMKRLGLAMEKVRAIFVSHEHTDHIKGVAMLSRKYQLPVYITAPTRKHAKMTLDKKLVLNFTDGEPVSVGRLTITPFNKHHDAVDPFSFTVSNGTVHVGVFTDIGTPCKELVKHFKKCHAAFLEANYDVEMLENGGYPYYLKTRIRGGKGHLSNVQALELFLKHKPAHMSHLLLSHLSKNNNDPKLVQQLFDKHANGVKMIVLSRYEESSVYMISSSKETKTISVSKKKTFVSQLKLLFE